MATKKTAPAVADLLIEKYNEYGLSPGVSKQRIVQKVEDHWQNWNLIQRHLNSNNNNQARERESNFIASLRKTFAVGGIQAANQRDFVRLVEGELLFLTLLDRTLIRRPQLC